MCYNIFRMANMNEIKPEEKISKILRAISSPARFRITAAIGNGEACVCHLEALLDLRQAYISQQLMELRDAGLLETRREGRYIYYRLAEPKIIELLLKIGTLSGIPAGELEELVNTGPMPHCCCPNCTAKIKPTLVPERKIPSQE